MNLSKEDLEVLSRYLRGFPLKKDDDLSLARIYRYLSNSKKPELNQVYPTLFRGIQSNKPIWQILDQAKYDNWTSWTTDINTAIYFAKTCQPKRGFPYLLITTDKKGIDVGCAIELAKNVKSLEGNSIVNYTNHEKEVILHGPLSNVFIMEIPTIYNII